MSVRRVLQVLAVAAGLQLYGHSLAAQAPIVTLTQGPAGVTVTWSMVKGRGVTYRVLRSLDPSQPGQDLTKPMGYVSQGFTDQSLAPNTTYFYQVVAVYGPGNESASAPVQFSPPAPAAPAGGSMRNKAFTPPVPVAPPPAPVQAITPSGSGQRTAATPTGVQPVAVAPPSPGPAPGYVQVTGNPAEAHVSWNAAYGASGYTVTRWSQTDPNCCRAQSAMLPANATGYDDLVQWPGTYTFRVKAIYPPDAAHPGGREGYTDVGYLYPAPQPPTRFQATQNIDGSIQFTWTAAWKASGYIFAGPPTNTAVRVNGTSITLPSAPGGRQTWEVWSQYDPPSGAQSHAASSHVPLTFNVMGSGKYRVTAQAIQVTQTTGDAPHVGRALSTLTTKNDGAGDEVFVTSVAQMLKRSDHNVIQTFPLQVSAVHGDVGAWPQDRRVRAGSASGNGGLNPGDVISPVFGVPAAGAQGWPPFILWEGPLIDGFEDLVLHPVIWDADQSDSELSRNVYACQGNLFCAPNVVNTWASVTTSSGSGAFLPAAKAAYQSPQIAVVPGQVIWIESDQYFRNLELQQRDRPIGLENDGNGPPAFGVTGRWRDMQVVLSREKIEAALASGNPTISLRMWEHWAMPGAAPTYNAQAGGDYTLVLRLDRIP